MAGKQTRTTIFHQWLSIVVLPALLLISSWGANTMINLLRAQAELTVAVSNLQLRATEAHDESIRREAAVRQDMIERETRMLRMVERLDDRINTTIRMMPPTPPPKL